MAIEIEPGTYQDLPLVPEALLVALERRFPNACPRLTDSDREVWAAVGAQQVLGFLRMALNYQRTAHVRE